MRRASESIVATAATWVALAGPATADSPPAPRYSIKAPEASAGSMIRRTLFGGTKIPINLRYEQLSDADRQFLASCYEGLAAGDEPPFPLEGLQPIHEAILKGQDKLLVEGNLLLIASVGADGQVRSVKAIGSPSPEMTNYVAAVLMFTRFKPGRCAGQPCAMEYPFSFEFGVYRE